MASGVSGRVVGSVVGAFVAEAAGVPIHWIYDPATLEKTLLKYQHPEFIPDGHCPFYRLPTGRNGCVGEQSLVLLESLVECKGFDAKDLRSRMYTAFGPDSDYEVKGTVTKDQLPISGPWRPGHLKAFVANFEENEEITGSKDGPNGDAYGKLIPLVALYAGKPELEKHVIELTRMTHDNDLSVQSAIAAAKVLEELILNGWTDKETPERIITDVAKRSPGEMKATFEAAVDVKNLPHKDAVQKFQSNCGLPQSLQTSLHAFLSAGFDTDYATAIRPTLTACGDNLPRLMFNGACVGARVGLCGIPKDWLDKTLKGDLIIKQAEEVAALREKI